jgi:rhomboid family protein
MIPLKDLNPSRTLPVITYSLIAINVMVFLYQASLPEDDEQELFLEYAVKPAFLVDYFRGQRVGTYPVEVHERDRRGREVVLRTERTVQLDWRNSILPLLTCMFLHGGLGHILGNMWFLYIFGDNVEDRLGHIRFTLFYLFAGAVAGLAQVAVTPDSAIPTIGASGAISGVLGAYLITYPHARVLSIVPIGFFFPLLEIPAYVFLIVWFGIQLVSGLISDPGQGGVAFWAHIGGFVVGLVAPRLMAPGRAPPPDGRWGKVRDVPFEVN